MTKPVHASEQAVSDSVTDTTGAHATTVDAPVHHLVDAHRAALQEHFPIPPARAAISRARMIKHGSTALAIAVLAGGVWWADPGYRTEQFMTRIGERTEVQLADGSAVMLDTATTLTVDWHLRSRRVALDHGRAQLRVAPSTWRPLTVDAGVAHVRVVGTRFDVWRKDKATDVSVYEGKVAVWRTDNTTRQTFLQAGEHITVSAEDNGVMTGEPFDENRSSAWHQGQFVFRNTPLSDALQDIQRYRDKPIRMQGVQLPLLRISGVFDSANTDQLLHLLPGILPVRVVFQPDGSVVVAER